MNAAFDGLVAAATPAILDAPLFAPVLAQSVESAAGEWAPITGPLQRIGLALIPLGLAVAIIIRFFFLADSGMQGESQKILRGVAAGGLLVAIAPALFLMSAAWTPHPNEVVSVKPAEPVNFEPARGEQKGKSCEELADILLRPKHKRHVERLRDEGKDKQADQALAFYKQNDMRFCMDNPVGPGKVAGRDE